MIRIVLAPKGTYGNISEAMTIPISIIHDNFFVSQYCDEGREREEGWEGERGRMGGRERKDGRERERRDGRRGVRERGGKEEVWEGEGGEE